MRDWSTSNARESSSRAMPGSGHANWERPPSDMFAHARARACGGWGRGIWSGC